MPDNKGNRFYELLFIQNDLTSFLVNMMKLKMSLIKTGVSYDLSVLPGVFCN